MFASYTEYNNYRINLNCCIAKKAMDLIKLLETGDECAHSESEKLFLLNAFNEILCKYKPKIVTEECYINADGVRICVEVVTEAVGCLSEDSYKKIINNINSLCEFCNCNQ